MSEQRCDFSGCKDPVREEDRTMSEGAKKYCEIHGAEIDELLMGGEPAKVVAWWVKSYGTSTPATGKGVGE